MDELHDPDPYPVRKPLQHAAPFCVDASDAFWFVTVCAAERGGTPFVDHADVIMDAARHYQRTGKWFLPLFMVMPDHIHMIVHPNGRAGVPSPAAIDPTTNDALCRDCGGRGATRPTGLAHLIAMWKHYLSHAHAFAFQRDFFDTRIRDDAHYAEKWDYIVRNPVARGLVATPREWPHVLAFDRATGAELPHR